eukprot:jgi/Tetstr1/436885/TSEL_025661.t1
MASSPPSLGTESAPAAADIGLPPPRQLTTPTAAAPTVGGVDDFRTKIPHAMPDGYHVKAAEDQCCEYYIKRKQRQCSRRRADGSQWCSLHEPGALAAERIRCQQKAPSSGASGVAAAAAAAAAAAGAEGAEEEGDPAAAGKKKTRLSGWRRRKLAAEAAGAAGAGGRVSSVAARMRNPFSAANNPALLAPSAMPDWRAMFADPSAPLLLDVGAARGLFVEGTAAAFPGRNYLGLEIRAPLVEEALARTAAVREARRNLAFVAANVLQERVMAALLASLASAGLRVDMVTVQFPDPWVAPKHRKRRTISPAFASACAAGLPDGAAVYVSSDVPVVLHDGAAALEAAGLARHVCPVAPSAPEPAGAAACGDAVDRRPLTDGEGMLLASPVGGGRVFSERDVVCEDLWRRVYRAMFFVSRSPGGGGAPEGGGGGGGSTQGG